MARTSVAKSNPKSNALVQFSDEAELDALRSRLAAPSGDKISISNKKFTLPGGSALDYLDIVIVDFVYFNKYYEGAYDPKVIVPPNCFALNQQPKEMVPSANSPDKQCESCTGCWANEFGSQGTGKACQNRVLLACLPTDAGPETPFVILDISPTALKSFSSYVGSVASTFKRLPYGVVTHIECNPTVKHDVCVFSDAQPFDMEDVEQAEFVAMVRARRGEALERLLTEPDVSSFKAANDAPKKGALKAPAKRRA